MQGKMKLKDAVDSDDEVIDEEHAVLIGWKRNGEFIPRAAAEVQQAYINSVCYHVGEDPDEYVLEYTRNTLKRLNITEAEFEVGKMRFKADQRDAMIRMIEVLKGRIRRLDRQ
jgi:hypothetical protein